MAYFVLFLVTLKLLLKTNVGYVVRTKKNRQILRGVHFIGNLKYSSDRTECLQSRLSCGLQGKLEVFGLRTRKVNLENECWDPLTNALQPVYQLLPQLLQWVPPYRRPALGDDHIHLHGKKPNW